MLKLRFWLPFWRLGASQIDTKIIKCEIMELEKHHVFYFDFSWFGYRFWKVLSFLFLDLFGFVGKRWFREKPCFPSVKSLFSRFGAIWNHSKIDWKLGSKQCGALIVFWKLLGPLLNPPNHDISHVFSYFSLQIWRGYQTKKMCTACFQI